MIRGLGGRSPADIAHHRKGVDFPVKKERVARHAKETGADAEVLKVIETMPDKEFGNMADVMKACGEADAGAERH